MKLKTQTLKGAALDYAVAVCEGMIDKDKQGYFVRCGQNGTALYTLDVIGDEFCPSIDWSQAGPIIEREEMKISPNNSSGWRSQTWGTYAQAVGDTPLQAAMRCYVASKLGDEVDVPEEVVA